VGNVVDLGITHVHAIGPLVENNQSLTCMFTSTYKLFICSYETNPAFVIIFSRMELFHLLEPYYEEKHRGRLTTEGELTTLLLLVDYLYIYTNAS
jgi:hypothetical protein